MLRTFRNLGNAAATDDVKVTQLPTGYSLSIAPAYGVPVHKVQLYYCTNLVHTFDCDSPMVVSCDEPFNSICILGNTGEAENASKFDVIVGTAPTDSPPMMEIRDSAGNKVNDVALATKLVESWQQKLVAGNATTKVKPADSSRHFTAVIQNNGAVDVWAATGSADPTPDATNSVLIMAGGDMKTLPCDTTLNLKATDGTAGTRDCRIQITVP